MDDTLLKAISTTGFPIAVSCYLLVKLQTTLERFSTRLDDLIVELRKVLSPFLSDKEFPIFLTNKIFNFTLCKKIMHFHKNFHYMG